MKTKVTTDHDENTLQQEEKETGSRPNFQQPITNDMSINRKKWKKIAIIVAAIVVVVPILLGLLLFIYLSGGINGLKPTPNPVSSAITSKRNPAKHSIESSFAEIDNDFGYVNYATSTHDLCHKAQNNWKISQGYVHLCTYKTTRFYGFNGDFRQQMIDFEQNIINIGWRSNYGSSLPLKEIMENDYDKYYGDKDPSVSQNFGGSYLVSSLPTPDSGYFRNEGVLTIAYAEKTTKTNDLSRIEGAQYSERAIPDIFYDKKNFQDINTLFQKITQTNKFILVVSIEEVYFHN